MLGVSASLKGYCLGSRNVVTVTVIVADIVSWHTPENYQWRQSLWCQKENLCITLRVVAPAVTVTHLLLMMRGDVFQSTLLIILSEQLLIH